MMKLSMSVICCLLFVAYAAQGRELTEVDVAASTIPNSRVELTMNKRSWEFLQRTASPASLEDIFCSGSERMELPVFGECPDYPGSVTLGFATCTQLFDVPKTFTFQEIVSGWFRMVCALDFANQVPVGEPSCDYSRCFYVEEPTFPWPELTIE